MYYRIVWACVYGVLIAVFMICIPIITLYLFATVACVNLAIQLNDYDNCGFEVFAIFGVSLSTLLSTGIFLYRRASNLDRALALSVSGIGICLFLEYIVELAGYGNFASLFIVALGYIISERKRWKTSWKPQKQFFALFLVMIFSVSLYTLGPNYIPVSQSFFDHEYSKVHWPLMLRLAGELCILIAVMHFGRGAAKWISAATRESAD